MSKSQWCSHWCGGHNCNKPSCVLAALMKKHVAARKTTDGKAIQLKRKAKQQQLAAGKKRSGLPPAILQKAVKDQRSVLRKEAKQLLAFEGVAEQKGKESGAVTAARATVPKKPVPQVKKEKPTATPTVKGKPMAAVIGSPSRKVSPISLAHDKSGSIEKFIHKRPAGRPPPEQQGRPQKVAKKDGTAAKTELIGVQDLLIKQLREHVSSLGEDVKKLTDEKQQLDKGAADEQRKGAVAAKKLRDAESVINNLKGQLQTQREESQSASLKLKHSDKEVTRLEAALAETAVELERLKTLLVEREDMIATLREEQGDQGDDDDEDDEYRPKKRQRTKVPDDEVGKNKASQSTTKHASVLTYHYRHNNFIELRPTPLLIHLGGEAFVAGYYSEFGTDFRTHGRVTFPQWAVDRAMEMANEFLAREARYPTKLGNRLNVATDATGRQLFLIGEVSCMLLYKVFESAVPPYTSNGWKITVTMKMKDDSLEEIIDSVPPLVEGALRSAFDVVEGAHDIPEVSHIDQAIFSGLMKVCKEKLAPELCEILLRMRRNMRKKANATGSTERGAAFRPRLQFLPEMVPEMSEEEKAKMEGLQTTCPYKEVEQPPHDMPVVTFSKKMYFDKTDRWWLEVSDIGGDKEDNENNDDESDDDEEEEDDESRAARGDDAEQDGREETVDSSADQSALVIEESGDDDGDTGGGAVGGRDDDDVYDDQAEEAHDDDEEEEDEEEEEEDDSEPFNIGDYNLKNIGQYTDPQKSKIYAFLLANPTYTPPTK